MKIKQELYVVQNGESLQLFSYEPETLYLPVVGSVDVEIDFDAPSDLEVRDAKIAMLKKKKASVQATAMEETELLNDSIQALMALEYTA